MPGVVVSPRRPPLHDRHGRAADHDVVADLIASTFGHSVFRVAADPGDVEIRDRAAHALSSGVDARSGRQNRRRIEGMKAPSPWSSTGCAKPRSPTRWNSSSGVTIRAEVLWLSLIHISEPTRQAEI